MNYRIDAIEILLSKECLLERYYPLICYKDELLKAFEKEHILSKDDAFNNEHLLKQIFKDDKLFTLFKLFLNMYEINKSKLKEIDKLDLTNEERKSYLQLYLLPGVKSTRAELYYLSSLKSLKDISNKSAIEIINLTRKTIINNKLIYKEPLLKEVNTHIAVAKLLTEYLID